MEGGFDCLCCGEGCGLAAPVAHLTKSQHQASHAALSTVNGCHSPAQLAKRRVSRLDCRGRDRALSLPHGFPRCVRGAGIILFGDR
jgi:hypothetical protein